MLSNTATPIEYGIFRDEVLSGKIIVNEYIGMQMERIDAKISNPDYYYDDEAIYGFIEFCENEMTLTDGSDLYLLPSFKLWAEDLLAWFYYTNEKVYNPETKSYENTKVLRRLCNKQYLIVARGAAKSLYETLLQAYFLILDRSTTHQVVVSPTMKQAEEIMQPFRTAMARAKGPLMKYLTKGSKSSTNPIYRPKLIATKKGIENSITNSLMDIRPMKIDKLQGLRSKYNTVDEWLSGKVSEDVIGAIEQGASKLNDYLIIAVSSEGTARDGVGDSIKMELIDILNGSYQDDHTSIFYYRLDNVQEVSDPEMWVKAQPNIGITVSYETYQRDVERAESQPATRNDILAKRFGIPVEGYTYFFTYEETLLWNKKDYKGMVCTIGADLSQGDDFTAFTFLFPLNNGQSFGIKTRSYVTKRKYMKLPKAMQYKYDIFVKEGSLEIVDNYYLDMGKVFDDLIEYIERNDYIPLSLGYDPYNANEFVELYTRVYGEYGVEKVRQGSITESVPLGELKGLSEDRKLMFDEELMKFAMGNAIVIEDNNGNWKLSKARSDEKIDNVSALMDAWVAYKRNMEAFG